MALYMKIVLLHVLRYPTTRHEDGIFVFGNEDKYLTEYGILLEQMDVSVLLRT
jgi:hypothetical protein